MSQQKQFGIYDTQLEYYRDEVYNTYEETVENFGEYWKDINFDSDLENYWPDDDNYESFERKTSEEKIEIVKQWQNNIANKDYIESCGFEIHEL